MIIHVNIIIHLHGETLHVYTYYDRLWFHSLPSTSIGMRTIVKYLLHIVNRKVSPWSYMSWRMNHCWLETGKSRIHNENATPARGCVALWEMHRAVAARTTHTTDHYNTGYLPMACTKIFVFIILFYTHGFV